LFVSSVVNRILLALPAIIACLATAGCVTRIATVAERKASISPYTRTQIGSQRIEEFLLRRTAFLISGDRLTVTPTALTTPANGRAFNVAGRKTSFRCGTATAIDSRGYFLTASHNLEGDAPYLAFYKRNQIQFTRSRVVWRGAYRKGQPDLAILHVPTSLEAAFEWAPDSTPGDVAVAAGLNSDRRSKFELVCLAGPVLKLDLHPSPLPGCTTIFHRAPVHPGDSGGPLVALDGRLIGINIELRPAGFLYVSASTSVAERPMLDWLRQTIAADVAARQSPGPSVH
jgi:S1-C subfamily serine protease